MIFRAFFYFFSLALAQAKITKPNSSQTRIIQGEDAKPGELPYQVSLQQNEKHFCGGSIINTKYVITAAHCVDGLLAYPNMIKICAGTVKLTQPQSIHQAEKIIMHNYNESTWENDIALIKVKNHFVFSKLINFIPLPKSDTILNTNQVVTVSGWGLSLHHYYGHYEPDHLQQANIVIADQNFCKQAYPYSLTGKYIGDTQFCAHHPNIIKGNCEGDSGSALTANGVLVGLVSWGADLRACGDPNFPTICTKVSKYVDWITAHAF